MRAFAPALLGAVPKPYYERHLVGVAWLLFVVATLCIELSGMGQVRAEATRKDRGSRMVLRICEIPAVVLLVLAPSTIPGANISPPLISVLVGIVVFAAGEATRIWARLSLGRYFTYTVMTSSDQPVITRGPYRWLRHPSYSGIMLIAIGTGAVWGNWVGLGALTLCTFAGVSYRIFVEERALIEELGERYVQYAAVRKRIIPFVW